MAPNFCSLTLIVEPKLYRDETAGIVAWQRAKAVDALQGANRRLVQRRYAARLLDPQVLRLAGAADIERDVHPAGIADIRVDLIFQPVLRYLLLHHAYVPRIPVAEIAASAAAEPEPAFGVVRGEHAIRTADRAALAERHLVVFRRFHRPRLLLRGHSRLGFLASLSVLVGNGNRFRRRFFLHLRQRLRQSF